jgi:heme-degrading monooxygenase HmoA
LFWLLGFPADYYYSVKINCIGCPSTDVWKYIKDFKLATPEQKVKLRADIEQLRKNRTARALDLAVIERKWGEEIVVGPEKESGWSFIDDLVIDPARLKFPENQRKEEMAKRHALTILAGMISHVDNQPGNQRMYCLNPTETTCPDNESWLVIQDLGATMGGFRLSWDIRNPILDRTQLALAMKVWRDKNSTAVFTNSSSCKVSVASLAQSQTLGPVKQALVSEAGRQFLLKRFYALGGGTEWSPEVDKTLRRQLRSVFIAGRNGELFETVDWWVETLMSKLEIVRTYSGCV